MTDCNCPRCQELPTKHRLADENEVLWEAVNSAASALDAAGRDPRRAAVVASYWLRTAFPTDHPNYLPTEVVRQLVRKAAA